MSLERGFKSWTERIARSLRSDLALSGREPLDPRSLATYLQIRLLTPNDVVGLPEDARRQLLVIDPSGWSAITVESGGRVCIIYNPSHTPARQSNDIAHEIAHVILGHKPATIIMSHDGAFAMRSYDQKQEDEANWLAAALLLPREALLYFRRTRLTTTEIAAHFGVSEQLATYRLRMTGVDAQLKAAAKFKR